MAKVNITIEAEIETSLTEGQIRYLVMDALAEFQYPRQNIQEYVDTRYPDTLDYKWLDRKAKVVEVSNRIRLAEALRCGNIEVTK